MTYKADSIIKNQIFNFIIQALNIIFPLIVIPYITRLFGPDILGEINFASSIVQYFLLIAVAGIPVYGTREVARYRDSSEKLNKKFREISSLQFILTIISLISYICFVLYKTFLGEDVYIYIFLGIQILSNAFNYVWLIQGLEKYRYTALASFITKLINLLLIFTLLNSKEDYYIYALIMGITVFINVFINLITSIRLLQQFKSEKKVRVNFNGMKTHLYAIGAFFLSDIAVKVYTVMDQTMLGMISGTESVGYYSMSIRLVKVILGVISSIIVVMIPRISNSIKNNRTDLVKKHIGMSIRVIYLLAIPAIFGIMAIGEQIIVIYLGIDFIESIDIFKLVSVLLIIIGLSNVFGMQVMIPYGKEKKFTMILLIAAIVNFILNIILIPEYSYMGATYATLIAELLVTILLYVEVKKTIGDIPEIKQISKIIIPSIIFYIVITFGVKTLVKSNFLIIIISIPIAIIIYGLGLILLKEDISIIAINKILRTMKNNNYGE